ncbi:MAG: STAS domain-containing protein, partial [Phycisphaeraceae bacterium]|nr:STAS domain-containing protein [Phycisphaeraceae bacterium]
PTDPKTATDPTATRKGEVVHFSRHGDILVATPSQPTWLERPAIDQFQKELIQAIKNEAPAQLVIHLGPVEYVSSAFIGALVAAHQEMAQQGRRLTLCEAGPMIRRLLKTTGLHKMMKLYDRLDQAIKKLS